MFGSRKNRTPNPPLNVSTVSPSATTAALTAFRRESTASTSSLSAAAAAAALRARPATPTDVASVQTKRTIRRSSSQYSLPNNVNFSQQRNSLSRQSSSGSMTERTFRSPSPGGQHQRSQSSGGTPRTAYAMVNEAPPPPVPAIPESVNMAAARARGARPKSLGFVSQPVKMASQRMAEKNNGGSWFGAAKVGDLGNVRKGDTIMRNSSVRTTASAHQPIPDSPLQESGSPVNFSYPARVRVASPGPENVVEEATPPSQRQSAAPKPKKRSSTISPQRGGSVRSVRPASIASDRELVYDPNSRRMVPRADLQTFEHVLQTPPVTKPKKKKNATSRAGSHLAKGTVNRARGSAVDSGGLSAAQMAAAASLKSHRPEEPVLEEEYYEEEPEAESSQEPRRQTMKRPVNSEPRIRRTELSMSPASNTPELFSPPLPDQNEGGLKRKPSVVREEGEESQSEVELEPPSNPAAALDAVPVRQNIYAHGVPSPPQSENTDDMAPAESAASSARSPEPILEKPEPRETRNIRRDSRALSNSPVRSAHFGPVQETLTVKHEPLRSLSPRKSALKRSPSRGTSPTGDSSDVSGVGTPTQEPPPPPRKKSVRVSFDDQNTIVVGEAAGRVEPDSPVPPSPQQASGRRSWYSTLGIGRKKDAVPLEEDEVMKPRPALPSFGSVRERKMSPQAAEERPLVRPLDQISETSSPERKIVSHDLGQSSDHALAAIINDQGSRIGANISKQREPLPPLVTSIEGHGYGSNSADSEDEAADLGVNRRLPAEESEISEASTLVPPRDTSGTANTPAESRDFGGKHEELPSISLTQPSPQPEQPEKERDSYIRFPGGFPETASESEDEDAPPRQVTFEPVVQKEDATSTEHTPATVLATLPSVQEVEQDTDQSSIYSDAYEDLDDGGDGFLSLNAVVESPITPPRHVIEKAHAQRAESMTPTPTSRRPEGSSLSEPADEWAAAKAYWRSLTADKRAQLEKEAGDDAGTEGDLEDVQKAEENKPRRKKSVEKRNAEKKAIEQQRVADTGRTYMITPGTKAGSINSEASPTWKPSAAPQGNQAQPNDKRVDTGTRLRKTVRSPTEIQPTKSETNFRKSMRADTEAQLVDSGTHMRKSMRSTPIEQPAPKQRPVSHQPVGSTSEIKSNPKKKHARTMSDTSSIPASVIQPSLRRRGSDSSVSSFRRARAALSTNSFGGFRKTMRASSSGMELSDLQRDQQRVRDTSSRFSLRATSPPSSMRTTLRGEQRRRSDDSGRGYLRFPGRSGGKSEKKKGKQTSRFGDDSSDEDEQPAARRFTSRFDDSSDEELTPLPKLEKKTMRSGRQDPPSPPLPEEEEMSDAGPPIVAGGGEGKLTRVTSARSGRGMDAPVGRQRRASFMSVLRRKKHDQDAKISRPGLIDSAARRDTTLERSADELSALRSVGSQESSKLQKRVVAMPISQQKDWPLTPTATADDDKDIFFDAADSINAPAPTTPTGQQARRSPSTLGHSKSQASMVMARPGFLMRRTTSGSDVGGKKKKFTALRKMLRLDE